MATSPITSNLEFPTGRSLDLHQVEDLLKLQKAAQKISSILDLDQLIDKIVNDVAVSFGCVEANLYLHNEERAEMVLAGVCGCTEHHKGHGLKIGKEGLVGYVAATGQMRYAPNVREDSYYMACEPSTLSEVAIPLHVGGRLVGVFTASHPELDAFPPEQLRLLQSLCSHVAVAVHNARLFQHEQHARQRLHSEALEARTIQQSLLPKSSPYIPGFMISGLSLPAGAVGGDWYDFIPLGEKRWGLVLADVSGKGTAAALLMSATRGMLRSLAEACCTPGEVLTKLNRLMVDDFPNGRFVTMIYAVLDAEARTLTFSSAGHLPPLLVDCEGGRFLASERGMPLGLTHGDYSESIVPIQPGSRIVLYSDGITEAEGPKDGDYGAERLKDHAMSQDATAESILADVQSYADGAGLHDDATVIFIRG